MKYWICFVLFSHAVTHVLKFWRTPYRQTAQWLEHVLVAAVFGYFTYYLWGALV